MEYWCEPELISVLHTNFTSKPYTCNSLFITLSNCEWSIIIIPCMKFLAT